MKSWLLNPFATEAYMADRFFDGPYGVLRDLLAKKDITLHTYDLGDLSKADMIISYCYDANFTQRCLEAGVPKEKLALIIQEPRAVIPEQYTSAIWDTFNYVFTFCEPLIDNKKFFRMRYVQGQHVQKDLPPFAKRKHLTLINAHKFSYVKGELYSARRRAIRYFEKQPDFDLYGFGWGEKVFFCTRQNIRTALKEGTFLQMFPDLIDIIRPYPAYRGPLDDKYKTLAQYKYAICFENEDDLPGYISEKIFDCYFCGTVPIYLGAPDIDQYLPADSYIDMRGFKNYTELSNYLRGLPEKEWQALHNAGQQFIASKEFQKWRPEGVFKEILEPFHV